MISTLERPETRVSDSNFGHDTWIRKQTSPMNSRKMDDVQKQTHEDSASFTAPVGQLREDENEPQHPLVDALRVSAGSDDSPTGMNSELKNMIASTEGSIPYVAYQPKKESSSKTLENEISRLLENNKKVPGNDDPDYLKYHWNLEKFAQQHHSKEDQANFHKIGESYASELQRYNQSNKDLSEEEINRRRELKDRLQLMNRLEKKMDDYDISNCDPSKVNEARSAFENYERLSKSDPVKADQEINSFLHKYGQDPEAKKIIRTLCYDEKDKKVGEKIYNKASAVESEQIFAELQDSFPRKELPFGGRGDCGKCADQVEKVLKEMDLQFHSCQRLKGTKPFTHIATELIEKRFDGSQETGAKDNIVLDMWLRGKNFASGFEALDYNSFVDPAKYDPNKMGAYLRKDWPITDGNSFGGTVR